MMAGFYGDVVPTALETAAYTACKKVRCAQAASGVFDDLDLVVNAIEDGCCFKGCAVARAYLRLWQV